jgi:hypothetical protein
MGLDDVMKHLGVAVFAAGALLGLAQGDDVTAKTLRLLAGRQA